MSMSIKKCLKGETSQISSLGNLSFHHCWADVWGFKFHPYIKSCLNDKAGQSVTSWKSSCCDVSPGCKRKLFSYFYCAYSTFASEVMKHCCRPVPIRRFLVLALPTRQKVLSGVREEKGALLHPALDPTRRIISISIKIITILIISIIIVNASFFERFWSLVDRHQDRHPCQYVLGTCEHALSYASDSGQSEIMAALPVSITEAVLPISQMLSSTFNI